MANGLGFIVEKLIPGVQMGTREFRHALLNVEERKEDRPQETSVVSEPPQPDFTIKFNCD